MAWSRPSCSGGISELARRVGDAPAAALGEHLARRRSRERQPRRLADVHVARAGGDHELVAVAQHDEHVVGLDQRAPALDHELEDALEVGLAADRAGDGGGGLQPAHGALELLAAGGHVAVEARVLDRDRGPVGEHDDGLLVLGRERLAAGLLGEVQVAVRLAADEDRHAEERSHRRVPGREAVGARMVADVVEAQRARVVDEHAEEAAPTRQVADGAVGLLVDPAREEAGELAACLVEDAERDVARAGEVGGGLQQPVEHRLEIELGQQAAPGVDEPREPVLVQAVQRRHARARA